MLILLASALGLTGWLVDAQIPDALLAAVKAHISSPYVFLLVLNGVLLVLGSVLEIYSAIIILAPLVAPIGAAFGIDPVHLGVVFLANLELGFLFPPAGLNLFLSSSRFNKRCRSLSRRRSVSADPRYRRARDHLRPAGRQGCEAARQVAARSAPHPPARPIAARLCAPGR